VNLSVCSVIRVAGATRAPLDLVVEQQGEEVDERGLLLAG
jgi:hypothetical protein